MHLREEALIDVFEGAAEAAARAHVHACAECKARLEELREGRTLAEVAKVPEPSPLYWDDFRQHVGRRIASEQSSRRFLGPVLAAAALLAGVALFWPEASPPPAAGVVRSLPAWTALPSGEDAGLSVLMALGPRAEDLEPALGCAGTAECLAELTEEESLALADVLRREIEVGGRS